MNINALSASELKSHLIQAWDSRLAGNRAHSRMMSYAREDAAKARSMVPPPKESGVMMMLFPEHNKWHTLFMLRPENQGVHSSQLSFPGGKKEMDDPSIMHTAIREAREEVGVVISESQIIGSLSEVYIPPSHFLVQPFVAILDQQPLWTPNADEVHELIKQPIDFFLTDGIIEMKEVFIPRYEQKLQVPSFNIQGKVLWGATAMMIQEFRMLFGDLH